MARGILGVVAGLAAWMAGATVVGWIMVKSWPQYASVAAAMAFTLPMMFARLAIGALATVLAGWATSVIARRSTLARLTTGVLLLALFIPEHIQLWHKFPVWYHLSFLLSLVPLTWLGGCIPTRWRKADAAPTRSADRLGLDTRQ
jgi:hypothetical protein